MWIWLTGHGGPEVKKNGSVKVMKEEKGRGSKKVRREEVLS